MPGTVCTSELRLLLSGSTAIAALPSELTETGVPPTPCVVDFEPPITLRWVTSRLTVKTEPDTMSSCCVASGKSVLCALST